MTTFEHDEDVTIEELEVAIKFLNEDAKKCKQVVGNENYESPWDAAHRKINELLDAREDLK